MNRIPSCIIDSSVILDFYSINQLNVLISFPYRLVTLDLMMNDLEIPELAEIRQAGISIVLTPMPIMLRMSNLAKTYNISTFDAALLLHAKLTKLCLLTGDRLLRRAAEAEKVVVRGSIWMLRVLISNKVIQPHEAALMLERMGLKGRRHPRATVQKLINKWRNI